MREFLTDCFYWRDFFADWRANHWRYIYAGLMALAFVTGMLIGMVTV